MPKGAYFYAIGKRKTARATVKLYPQGTGEIHVNGVTLREWSDTRFHMHRALAPLEELGKKKDYDIEIRVSGGGTSAQSESISLGIARALEKSDQTLRTQLKEGEFLTRDSRIKERQKPGLKKARRAPQFSKR